MTKTAMWYGVIPGGTCGMFDPKNTKPYKSTDVSFVWLPLTFVKSLLIKLMLRYHILLGLYRSLNNVCQHFYMQHFIIYLTMVLTCLEFVT